MPKCQGFLARNRCHIWNSSKCNGIRTYNHLVLTQTLNQFGQMYEWLFTNYVVVGLNPVVVKQILIFFLKKSNVLANLLSKVWQRVQYGTAQKVKFSIKDFFSKCDQIHRKLRIWSHLLKKPLLENSIFCGVRPILYSSQPVISQIFWELAIIIYREIFQISIKNSKKQRNKNRPGLLS